jgi:hypothetical protein
MWVVIRLFRMFVSPFQEWNEVKKEEGHREYFFLLFCLLLSGMAQCTSILISGQSIGGATSTLQSIFFMFLGIAALFVCTLIIIFVCYAFYAFFGYGRDLYKASRLIIYSSTPFYLGSLFSAFYWVKYLQSFFFCYSLFILWKGILLLMEVDHKKVPIFFLSIVITSVICLFISILSVSYVGSAV